MPTTRISATGPLARIASPRNAYPASTFHADWFSLTAATTRIASAVVMHAAMGMSVEALRPEVANPTMVSRVEAPINLGEPAPECAAQPVDHQGGPASGERRAQPGCRLSLTRHTIDRYREPVIEWRLFQPRPAFEHRRDPPVLDARIAGFVGADQGKPAELVEKSPGRKNREQEEGADRTAGQIFHVGERSYIQEGEMQRALASQGPWTLPGWQACT